MCRFENSVDSNASLDISRYELKVLAKDYLCSFIQEEFFSFVTGIYGGSSHFAKEDRYFQIAELLEPNENNEIIATSDLQFQKQFGDQWDVMKCFLFPNFFLTPPNKAAMRRVADNLSPPEFFNEDEYWNIVANQYSIEFAECIEHILEEDFVDLCTRFENTSLVQ